MLLLLSAALLLSLIFNGILFYKWATRTILISDHHEMILEVVKQFERSNHCLLEIQAINPENVFLRSPSR